MHFCPVLRLKASPHNLNIFTLFPEVWRCLGVWVILFPLNSVINAFSFDTSCKLKLPDAKNQALIYFGSLKRKDFTPSDQYAQAHALVTCKLQWPVQALASVQALLSSTDKWAALAAQLRLEIDWIARLWQWKYPSGGLMTREYLTA
jgi:hypothetical protein